ncbi:unnamed protein product [Schistocephalus solidus]|uniref:Ras-GEF domain-containing protein n=1 Tax=Schistocephalus solidus TaxID=70667 RepID=A0A183T761_SCHSO|nr:unnamed protein product [Schistocephalus solidus]
MEERFTGTVLGPPAMYVYANDEVIEPGQAPKISLRALNEHLGFLRSECFESILDDVTVPLLPAEVDRLRQPSSRRLRQPSQEPLNLQPSSEPSNPPEIVGLTPLVPYSLTQSVHDPRQGSAPTSQETLLDSGEPPTSTSAAFLETLKLSPFMRGCMNDVRALRDSDPPDWTEGWQVNIF